MINPIKNGMGRIIAAAFMIANTITRKTLGLREKNFAAKTAEQQPEPRRKNMIIYLPRPYYFTSLILPLPLISLISAPIKASFLPRERGIFSPFASVISFELYPEMCFKFAR